MCVTSSAMLYLLGQLDDNNDQARTPLTNYF